jgi:hypothetical protein
MAFDGFGTFIRLRSWVADAAAGVKIRADFHDDEDNNLAAGLTNCIVKDGQTTITQNIPFNSKRVTALADPVDPQDAATKAYADTKLAKTGDGAVTGNLTVTGNTTITGNLNVGGTVAATGYKTRKGVPGPYGANAFNFDWTGNLEAWVDNTNLGALATQVFANTAANNAAASKLPLAGGTITGALQVNGELIAVQNYLRFGASGGPGYLIWNGGASYSLGGAGTIWHSGNFNPATISASTVTNARMPDAGGPAVNYNGWQEPLNGAFCTGWLGQNFSGVYVINAFRMRYLQLYTTSWWSVGYI